MLERGLLQASGFLALMCAFGVAYGQYPLYYLAQNQYFFYGLVRAGFGHLQDDWLAGTADPWPAFTMLVEFTSRYWDLRAVYAYFLLLLGVYAYSMLGIVSRLFGLDRSKSRYLAALALVTVVHSSALGLLTRRYLGFDLSRTLIDGVASQRILWDMFQPGAFGAFLLLSILLFMRGRPFLAVASAAVAATVHPSYLLGAGILTLSYLAITVHRGEGLWRAAGLALWAFVLVLPALGYAYAAFRPTGHDLWAEAQWILVHFRNARHAEIGRWLNALVYAKLAVVLAGLYVVRRTELFWIMVLSFAAALGLTVTQALTGSVGLAAIYPWRLSVYIVPLSTVVVSVYVLTWVLDRLEGRFPRSRQAIVTLSIVALVGLASAGVLITRQRFSVNVRVGSAALMEFVRAEKSLGETYLIPENWREFRLYTGAPTYVDFWFIPYNDVAVVEWDRRIKRVETYYRAHGTARCEIAQALWAASNITHIVAPRSESERCPGWMRVFQDTAYVLSRRIP